MSQFTRRSFIRQAAGAAAASFIISGTKSSGRVMGANDRIRIAVAGINGRGQVHFKCYCAIPNVEVAYLVDPDSRLFASRSAAVKKLSGNTPQCVQDIRRALDDKNLDAVSIVTPDHWHALMGIWACQAGKDVHVEKPCSHNIVEGRRLVEAARKYNRIVQHGAQRRSDPEWIKLTSDIRKRKYGKLLLAYAFANRPRESIGIKATEPPPAELDYNLWVGPSPMHPFRTNLVHYEWHWIWDFGTGELGNLGTHQLDMARCAMPVGTAPQSVVSLGGRYGYKDQGETPNTQLTFIDFGDVKLVCEQRGLVTKKDVKVTVEFHTDAGVIKEGQFFPKGKQTGEPIKGCPLGGFADQGQLHFRNFIDCMRSRKREDINGEILEGHQSTVLAHLGNISYRLGKDVSFDGQPQVFADDKMARQSFDEMQKHLVAATGKELTGTTYRLGRSLRFDAQAEKFHGDDDANRMLSRPYRKPFAVPEQV